MWDAALMIGLKTHYDTRLFEKSDHLLGHVTCKTGISPGIQADLAATLFLNALENHDCM